MIKKRSKPALLLCYAMKIENWTIEPTNSIFTYKFDVSQRQLELYTAIEFVTSWPAIGTSFSIWSHQTLRIPMELTKYIWAGQAGRRWCCTCLILFRSPFSNIYKLGHPFAVLWKTVSESKVLNKALPLDHTKRVRKKCSIERTRTTQWQQHHHPPSMELLQPCASSFF